MAHAVISTALFSAGRKEACECVAPGAWHGERIKIESFWGRIEDC
jgi:hypothetical protein